MNERSEVLKTCLSCEASKPWPAFPRSRNSPDGYSDTCSDCKAAQGRASQRSHKAQGQRRVYDRKRSELYRLLGGKCAVCGTQEPPLHLDHIDWRLKTMEVLQRQLSLRDPRVREELKNIQLLCQPHHDEKTVVDHAEQKAEADVLKKRNQESEWLTHERKKRGRREY